MSKELRQSYENLWSEIVARGSQVNEIYNKVILDGVEHPILISILEDVRSYWKDYYRTALTSFSCEAVGGKPEDTYPVSLFISLAGSGIGIHDDIIDKTKIKQIIRRPIPELHSSDDALIIGDLLIVKGLTATRELLREKFESKLIYDILDVYERFFLEICAGEIMEIRYRKNLDVELDQYHKTLWKLGVDSEACTKIGAMIGKGKKHEIKALAEYGKHLGYLYRLLDEVKDTINIEGNLSNKIQNESIPLPLLYTVKKSKKNYDKIKSIIEQPAITPSHIKELLTLCYDNQAFKYVKGIAFAITEKAHKKLDILVDSDALDSLKLLLKKLLYDIETIC